MLWTSWRWMVHSRMATQILVQHCRAGISCSHLHSTARPWLDGMDMPYRGSYTTCPILPSMPTAIHAPISTYISAPVPSLVSTQHIRQFLTVPGLGGELSKKHRERRLVGWSPQQLYEVVADVTHYKEFVPWCQRSVVTLDKDNYMEAELEVGFRVFVERYTSKIILNPGKAVHSKVADSTLFEHLDCHWEFAPGPTPASCWLTFRIDFAFRSPLYRHAATMFFEEVVQRMLGAFQGRAAAVYGPSSLVRRAAPPPMSPPPLSHPPLSGNTATASTAVAPQGGAAVEPGTG